MATKLRALYQRRKGRDLFDLWYVTKNKLINLDRVFEIFAKYCANDDSHFTKDEFLKNLELKREHQAFQSDMHALLPAVLKWDFGEAYKFLLKWLSTLINQFILGNHDYYQGSVVKVRQKIAELSQENPLLHWLPKIGLVYLSKDTILVGEDCWADGRYGNYTDSRVVLNDSRMIQELREGSIIGKYQLLNTVKKLADSDAMRLKKNLQSAIMQHSYIN